MTQPPRQPAPTDQVSRTIDAHVREIIAAAENAADQLRHDMEQEALRAAEAIRRDAELDAARVRAEAADEAAHRLEDAHRRIRAFTEGRVARIEELTDDLLARAEAIQVRLEEAQALRDELEALVSALRAAAAAATAEAGRPPVRLPGRPAGDAAPAAPAASPAPAPRPAPPPRSAPAPRPAPPPRSERPVFDDPDVPLTDPDEQVREIARELPRPPRPRGAGAPRTGPRIAPVPPPPGEDPPGGASA